MKRNRRILFLLWVLSLIGISLRGGPVTYGVFFMLTLVPVISLLYIRLVIVLFKIYQDLDGKIDYLVAGAGSGGTFSGVMKYLKEQNPAIRGVLADPVGSTMGGGEHADYNIEGIGNDFIADTMDMSLVDKVIKVNDDDAFSGSRLLAKKEGICLP